MIGSIADRRHESIVREGGDACVSAKVWFTRHAIEQYSNRVDFCIGPIEAAGRLRSDAESSGEVLSVAPEWMVEGRNEQARSAAYLVIGKDYVLPLVADSEGGAGLKAVTLISRKHGSHVIHKKRCRNRNASRSQRGSRVRG